MTNEPKTHAERFSEYLAKTKRGLSFAHAQGEVLDMTFTDMAVLEAKVARYEAALLASLPVISDKLWLEEVKRMLPDASSSLSEGADKEQV